MIFTKPRQSLLISAFGVELNGTFVTDTTAKYLGPCAPGMNPGDIQTADGRIMTPEQVRAAMRARFGGGGGAGGMAK
jgi:hypothetical protein